MQFPIIPDGARTLMRPTTHQQPTSFPLDYKKLQGMSSAHKIIIPFLLFFYLERLKNLISKFILGLGTDLVFLTSLQFLIIKSL